MPCQQRAGVSYKLSLQLNEHKVVNKRFMHTLKNLQQNALFPKFRQTQHEDVIRLKEFRFKDDKTMISYYGQISLGPTVDKSQQFKVLFDTGSTDIFIPSKNCTSYACKKHKKYNKSESFEFVKNAGEIQYVAGSITSMIGADNVYIGNIQLPKQKFHVGEKVEIPIFETSKWDGIVGLGFTQQHEMEDFGMSIIDTFKDKKLLKNPIFSFYLSEKDGYLVFGSYPKEIEDKIDQIKWAPLKAKSENSWSILLYDVLVKKQEQKKQFRHALRKKALHQLSHQTAVAQVNLDKNFTENPCGKKGCELLIDTGTYLTYIPRGLFQYYFRDVDFSKISNCQDIDKLPQIVFKIGGFKDQKHELVFNPKDYILVSKLKGEPAECAMGIAPDDQVNNLVTIGQEFLRSFCTIFDFNEKRIGFIPIVNQKSQSIDKIEKKEDKQDSDII